MLVHRAGPRRRWRLVALIAAAVVVIALGTAVALAATYQPVGWGSFSTRFPGMPLGQVHGVNDFALLGGDYYIPPQRGEVSFGVSIADNGPLPITIDAVTLGPAADTNQLWISGQVRWSPTTGTTMRQHSYVLRTLTIQPGYQAFIGIPLRTRSCGQTDGWAVDPDFYVREHFLFFRHTVALPWSMTGARLIMRLAGGRPGDPHTICAAS